MARQHLRAGPGALYLILGLLTACDGSDAPDDDLEAVRAPAIVRIVPADEALAGAHVPTLDPVTMNDAEIRKAIADEPRCVFRYTSAGKPVLAIALRPDGVVSGGVVKLNGSLITLGADVGQAGDLVLAADPVRMTVTPDRGDQPDLENGVRRWEANMIFEVGQDLKVGYRGYFGCAAEVPIEPPPG